MVQDAVAHLESEVQTRAAVFDALHHAHRLLVVAVERRGLGRAGREPLMAREARGQRPPVCPKGCGPGSWPSEMASVRSSFSPSARA